MYATVNWENKKSSLFNNERSNECIIYNIEITIYFICRGEYQCSNGGNSRDGIDACVLRRFSGGSGLFDKSRGRYRVGSLDAIDGGCARRTFRPGPLPPANIGRCTCSNADGRHGPHVRMRKWPYGRCRDASAIWS